MMQSAELQKVLDELWTVRDVCAYFRKSTQTILTWRQKKGLPTVELKADRPAVRFIPSDVKAWADENDIIVPIKRRKVKQDA